jgi:hypothetical protein
LQASDNTEVTDTMRYAVDPRQKPLLDPAETMFSPMAIRHLREDWPGLFRTQILHLMPVAAIAEHFHPTLGCRTKELYSMAGLIFLKEFFNLTIAETIRRYLMDAGWQYALNVVPTEASLSHATIERYMKLFAENDLAAEIFHRVTSALVEALELDLSRQRLDSTHVFSDMATFGRTKLMGVAIKRFLTQLKRHERALYDALPEEFRIRYAPSQARLFADFRGGQGPLRQSVADDLLFLVNRFSGEQTVTNRTSYQAMRRILEEQCTVSQDKTEATVKAQTGGDVMQNPSDADATNDGHKGPGYQVQIAETCSEANDAQLITGVEVEAAHCSDQEAVVPMLEQLEQHGRQPEALYGDTGYGRDQNVVEAERRGVDLQSPVGGVAPQNQEDLTVDQFVIDESTETVERCPNGRVPRSSTYDPAKRRTRTVMERSDCSGCAYRSQCAVREVRGEFVLDHTGGQRRIAARRAEQATDVFRENYRVRAGGESVNSGLKRRTGMGRLRTRGSPHVRLAVLLRCAGWNVFRALAAFKKRGIRDFVAFAATSCRILRALTRRQAAATRPHARPRPFPRPLPRPVSSQPLPVAA